MRTRLRRTDDVIAERTLRRVLGSSPGKVVKRISVCAGEWRKEPNGRWRFWADKSWAE